MKLKPTKKYVCKFLPTTKGNYLFLACSSALEVNLSQLFLVDCGSVRSVFAWLEMTLAESENN